MNVDIRVAGLAAILALVAAVAGLGLAASACAGTRKLPGHPVGWIRPGAELLKGARASTGKGAADTTAL
mgnify:CR=1 FL=1